MLIAKHLHEHAFLLARVIRAFDVQLQHHTKTRSNESRSFGPNRRKSSFVDFTVKYLLYRATKDRFYERVARARSDRWDLGVFHQWGVFPPKLRRGTTMERSGGASIHHVSLRRMV